jgi:hypothetical protein
VSVDPVPEVSAVDPPPLDPPSLDPVSAAVVSSVEPLLELVLVAEVSEVPELSVPAVVSSAESVQLHTSSVAVTNERVMAGAWYGSE